MKYVIWIALVIISACNTTSTTPTETSPPYTEVEASELNLGDIIPQPVGEVVLTITGNINTTNVDDTLQFDMETLEKLGLVEYSVNDKQAEGKVVTFQGVLLSSVLNIADVNDDAATLHTIALNDYSVDIPIEDARDFPVLIATRVDGERMSVERYGPTRIIYPYESFEFDETTYDSRWIWQLAEIEVR